MNIETQLAPITAEEQATCVLFSYKDFAFTFFEGKIHLITPSQQEYSIGIESWSSYKDLSVSKIEEKDGIIRFDVRLGHDIKFQASINTVNMTAEAVALSERRAKRPTPALPSRDSLTSKFQEFLARMSA